MRIFLQTFKKYYPETFDSEKIHSTTHYCDNKSSKHPTSMKICELEIFFTKTCTNKLQQWNIV